MNDAPFRLSGAARRDPEVDAWLASRDADLRPLATSWFAQLRRCGDDVRELMHDGCPVACVGDAAFGYVNVFREHVSVGFFHGADLDDPAELLTGAGKRMRHVRLRPGDAVNSRALAQLVEEAYLDVKRRLARHAAGAGSPLRDP